MKNSMPAPTVKQMPASLRYQERESDMLLANGGLCSCCVQSCALLATGCLFSGSTLLVLAVLLLAAVVGERGRERGGGGGVWCIVVSAPTPSTVLVVVVLPV